VTTDAFIKWGFEIERIRPFVVVHAPPSVCAVLRGRALPPTVEVVEVEDMTAGTADDDGITVAQRLAWVRAARRRRAFAAEALFWIDFRLCLRHLSLHYLYTDLLTRTLAAIDSPTCFGVPGYPEWSLFGGPTGTLALLLALPEPEAIRCFTGASTAEQSPMGLRRWNDHHPVDEPNLYFSVARTDPTLHVIGDSHIFNCFTPPELLAQRANVLWPRPARSANTRVPPLLFAHHAGGVTMHRAGRDGVLAEFARDYRVRDGDTVVWVFGEIDVRCHIVRQHEFLGRDPDEIVTTLVRNFVGRMVELRASYPRLSHVVFAPIPPLDNPDYQSDRFPVHGSIAQRIAARQALVSQLRETCRPVGIPILDIASQFATVRGDLEWDKSDSFCHLAHGFQRGILEQLFELIDAPAAVRTT
jgi:hypothetical protein